MRSGGRLEEARDRAQATVLRAVRLDVARGDTSLAFHRLVGMNLPLQQNFMAIAIPAVIGMVAVLFVNHDRSASAHPAEASVERPQAAASVSVAQGG